jgi:hypothetical protein
MNKLKIDDIVIRSDLGNGIYKNRINLYVLIKILKEQERKIKELMKENKIAKK